MKFIVIMVVLFTINQCGSYSNPNQDETATDAASGKPTGKRQHKPFS